MFIADNGLCAGGDVPSHVLEEGLQMSPATGALPLPHEYKMFTESTVRVKSLPFQGNHWSTDK